MERLEVRVVRERLSAPRVARVGEQGFLISAGRPVASSLPAERDADTRLQLVVQQRREGDGLEPVGVVEVLQVGVDVVLCVPDRQRRAGVRPDLGDGIGDPVRQRQEVGLGVGVRVLGRLDDAAVERQEIGAVLVREPVVDHLHVARRDRIEGAGAALAGARALDHQVRTADLDGRVDALQRVVDRVVHVRVRGVVPVVERARPEALHLVPDDVVLDVGVAKGDLLRQVGEVRVVGRSRRDVRIGARIRPEAGHPVGSATERDHRCGAHRADQVDPRVERRPVVRAG